MQLDFTLTLRSDYHIGAGHGLGSQIDSALLRDGDRVPVLRGSTLEGLLRDGLWRLLQTLPLRSRRKCRASGLDDDSSPAYCAADPCPLCLIFGTPAQPKHWRISSARPEGVKKPLFKDAQWKQGQTGTQVAARVRVSPRMRRTEPRKLFQQEEGGRQLKFAFTADCIATDAEAHHEAALLVAAARMVRRFGSARRRGRGECSLALTSVTGWYAELAEDTDWQDHLLEHFNEAWLVDTPPEISVAPATWTGVQATGNGAKRFLLIIRVDEPIVVARRAEAGNIFDCAEHIPTSTLIGALAHEAAERWDLSDQVIYGHFLDIFRRGAIRFMPLYPAHFDENRDRVLPTIPPPMDLLVCKIDRRLDEHNERRSYAVSRVPDECCLHKCGIPLVPLGEFVSVKGVPEPIRPKLCEEMHPQINPRTQRAATGNLYGYVAFATGQYFIGEIHCRDEHTWKTLCQLTGIVKEQQPFPLRLGKGTGRGYGLVAAYLEPITDVEMDPWRGIPLTDRVPSATAAITLTLLTDAILSDRWGRFQQTLDARLLEELIGQPVEIINTFCKTSHVSGFNNHLGLPRWRDLAIKAGSAVGFQLRGSTDLASLQSRLRAIENEGIGLRRHEGFGLVVFNHPIYAGGAGVSGTSFVLPTELELGDAPTTGIAAQIRSDFDFIRTWSEDLQDETKFREGLFRDSKWDAVARWLYGHASQEVSHLKTQLEAFGNPGLLTDVTRKTKAHFTEADAQKAIEHLHTWLDKAKDQPVMVRGMVIRSLAHRIAASVQTKGE